MKNSFLGILLPILLASLTVACGNDGTGAPESDTQSSKETAVPETVTEEDSRLRIPDNLPEVDYEGYKFRINLRKNGLHDNNYEDLYAEENAVDIVEEAVYKRNLQIEERFNIEFEYSFDDTGAATYSIPAVVAITAGEDAYDLVGFHGAFAFRSASQNHLLDWNEYMTYCDLDAVWWDKDFRENMTIAGKLYCMTGDISYMSIGATFCLLFNKRLMETYDLAFPYELVRTGNWTFDQFKTYALTVVEDLNGDTKITPEADQYGLYSGSWRFPIAAFYMAGDRVITMNEDGVPEWTLYNDRTVSLFDDLMEFYDKEGIWVEEYSPAYAENIFRQGRALFVGGMMSSLKEYRDMEDDIGIIPYPKYDESVDRYYCLVDAGKNVFGIPQTVSDAERISVIVEALAAEGYRSVTPIFYEDALKSKYARDEESAEMLELIRQNRTFDYGYFDSTASYDFSYVGRYVLLGGKNFTSWYERRVKGATKILEKIYESYTEEY